MAPPSRKKQRVCFFITVFLSLAATALIGTSMGTEYWMQSHQWTSDNTSNRNLTANLGLFRGAGEVRKPPLSSDNKTFQGNVRDSFPVKVTSYSLYNFRLNYH